MNYETIQNRIEKVKTYIYQNFEDKSLLESKLKELENEGYGLNKKKNRTYLMYF